VEFSILSREADHPFGPRVALRYQRSSNRTSTRCNAVQLQPLCFPNRWPGHFPYAQQTNRREESSGNFSISLQHRLPFGYWLHQCGRDPERITRRQRTLIAGSAAVAPIKRQRFFIFAKAPQISQPRRAVSFGSARGLLVFCALRPNEINVQASPKY